MDTQIRLIAGEAQAPRNQWYVIAFSSEVGRKPLARMITADPVVLYRREDGTPVALFDRCPHRDQVALAEVQQLFDSLEPQQRVEVSVKADNPAWRARHIIEWMIKQERRAEAQPSV
jgi:hypothetical protein